MKIEGRIWKVQYPIGHPKPYKWDIVFYNNGRKLRCKLEGTGRYASMQSATKALVRDASRIGLDVHLDELVEELGGI